MSSPCRCVEGIIVRSIAVATEPAWWQTVGIDPTATGSGAVARNASACDVGLDSLPKNPTEIVGKRECQLGTEKA